MRKIVFYLSMCSILLTPLESTAQDNSLGLSVQVSSGVFYAIDYRFRAAENATILSKVGVIDSKYGGDPEVDRRIVLLSLGLRLHGHDSMQNFFTEGLLEQGRAIDRYASQNFPDEEIKSKYSALNIGVGAQHEISQHLVLEGSAGIAFRKIENDLPDRSRTQKNQGSYTKVNVVFYF